MALVPTRNSSAHLHTADSVWLTGSTGSRSETGFSLCRLLKSCVSYNFFFRFAGFWNLVSVTKLVFRFAGFWNLVSVTIFPYLLQSYFHYCFLFEAATTQPFNDFFWKLDKVWLFLVVSLRRQHLHKGPKFWLKVWLYSRLEYEAVEA